VEVLWEVGRSDPHERQGGDREVDAEGSGVVHLRADEQEPDTRRSALTVSGPKAGKLLRPRRQGVDRAAVRGDPLTLTWGDLALRLKGRRHSAEREVSRGGSSRGL
jgi:hypothetical protein